MARKKKDKNKSPDRSDTREKKKEEQTGGEDQDTEDNRFGGIPSRDLRKNLGCGG